tara:strand:+ start:1277 stop:1876 length:600 start_codon:yes stop_codon:yes gene_type:complete
MNISDLFQGFIIGSTLIIAIGPQNLFVISQGLKKQFVFIVVLFCSLSDSLLIVAGINLSNFIIGIDSRLIITLKIIGGGWLILYGFNKIRKLRSLKNISENIKIKENLKSIFITLFLITYANPHVYLDTVILLGSISTNFNNKFLFGLGAVIASFVFFFSLGYLSKFLSKYIYSQKTWFLIDLIVGILMICYGMYFIFY